MSDLVRTFSNTANKVQGCLRQPIFNDCIAVDASRGQKGEDIQRAVSEEEADARDARGTKIEARDSAG